MNSLSPLSPKPGFRAMLALDCAAWLALAFPAGLPAGDWTQFRGPAGNGVTLDPDLPTHLDPGRNIAWKVALPGRGLSSPVIVGDRAFVTSASGPSQQRLHVVCFSTKDGSKVWERQFWATGRTMTHEKTCVAASTPVSDGERLYALYSSNDLVCLDLDGNLVWLRGLTLDYPNASNSLGMSSSPTIAGGALIVQIENDSESFAAGLDLRTGINLWKTDRPKAANWTSPQTMAVPRSAQTVVALQSSKGIHAIDPATGKVIWHFDNGASTIPSSASSDDILFVPSNGITALKSSNDGKSFEELWQSSQLRPDTASPLVLHERVYILNSAGILSCGHAMTGDRLWQLRLTGPFSASPVTAGNYLYLVNEKGLVQVIEPAGKGGGGELVSSLDLQETILSTPSIARGAIFIRSDNHLWKLTKG